MKLQKLYNKILKNCWEEENTLEKNKAEIEQLIQKTLTEVKRKYPWNDDLNWDYESIMSQITKSSNYRKLYTQKLLKEKEKSRIEKKIKSTLNLDKDRTVIDITKRTLLDLKKQNKFFNSIFNIWNPNKIPSKIDEMTISELSESNIALLMRTLNNFANEEYYKNIWESDKVSAEIEEILQKSWNLKFLI